MKDNRNVDQILEAWHENPRPAPVDAGLVSENLDENKTVASAYLGSADRSLDEPLRGLKREEQTPEVKAAIEAIEDAQRSLAAARKKIVGNRLREGLDEQVADRKIMALQKDLERHLVAVLGQDPENPDPIMLIPYLQSAGDDLIAMSDLIDRLPPEQKREASSHLLRLLKAKLKVVR